ncbi:MAG TPA: hypothetical protein VFU86_06575, partial [Terriglobales bacterium]|nr:hypothetical protein [Terriglobales bacterium]
MNERFTGYFGHPDFHDAEVVSIQQENAAIEVTLRSEQGACYVVSFRNASVLSRNPIGMRLYAISRMAEPNNSTRHVFVNWDEQIDSALEITSEGEPTVR